MLGKVYKIVCNKTDEVYYGSTIQTLPRRKAEHIRDAKKDGKCVSKIIIDRGDWEMKLVEEIEYQDIKEVRERERYYIENNTCVNKFIPNRTEKEYREQHRERILLRDREKKKEKCICSCGVEVFKHHLNRHMRTQKHLNRIT